MTFISHIRWKWIQKRYIPKGGQISQDRIPTIDEIKKIIEYPDRRIKPLTLVQAAENIRMYYLPWYDDWLFGDSVQTKIKSE